MELRHLRYFVAVAEILNFREAAESLNLSAPGLSKQIKDLEEEIGVRLLDRNTAQVQLTNAGTLFLTEAREILAHAGRAVEIAQEAAKGRRGRLVVGNIGALTANYMATCLTNYCARYPDVDVELVDMDVTQQITALNKREIHVGFVPADLLNAFPESVRHASILTAPLFAVMTQGHRLENRTNVSLDDISKERILIIGGGKPAMHGVYISRLFTNRGLTPPKMTEVHGFESLGAMIAGGQGVSLLAGRGSIMRLENIAMRPLKETGPDMSIEICAAWQTGESALLAENFIEVFRCLSTSKKSTSRSSKPKRNSAAA